MKRFARIMQSQYAAACKDDNPHLIPYMVEDNITKWYYVACNLPRPFEDGEYIFCLDAPSGFPQKPPKFSFVTPNGVYEPGGPICISIGEFHANDKPGHDGASGWRPALGMRGFAREVVNGMLVSSNLKGGIRILNMPDSVKMDMAGNSTAFNAKQCPKIIEAIQDFEKAHPDNVAVKKRRMLRAAASVRRLFANNTFENAPLEEAFGSELWPLTNLKTASAANIKAHASFIEKAASCYDPIIKKMLALTVGGMLGGSLETLLELLDSVCGSASKDTVPPIVNAYCKANKFADIASKLFVFLSTENIDLKAALGRKFVKKYGIIGAKAPLKKAAQKKTPHMVAPQKEEVAPQKEEVAPQKEEVAPGPQKEEVAPQKEEVAPGPQKEEVAPQKEEVAPQKEIEFLTMDDIYDALSDL